MHTTTSTNTTKTATITALVQTGFGDPAEVLRVGEVERPQPASDGVLVRVHAASVHVGAVYGVRGLPMLMRPMFKKFIAENGVIGQHMAGTVAAVGRDVTGLTVGDPVVGWCNGAYAEYAATTSQALAPKPTNLTFEEAAALGVSAFTALQALRDHGDLQPGQHLLVTGASGGVGTFAVQIAKAMGAEVTGVCSTRNLDLVRSIGADHVVDYTRQDFTEGEPKYDLILDNVGDPLVARHATGAHHGRSAAGQRGTGPTGWVGGMGHPLKVACHLAVRSTARRPVPVHGDHRATCGCCGTWPRTAGSRRSSTGCSARGRRGRRGSRRRGPQPGDDRHRHVTHHAINRIASSHGNSGDHTPGAATWPRRRA